VDGRPAPHPRLVVLGDPGSGKTTLLRYLTLLYARDLDEWTTLVQDRLGLERSEHGRLPILLRLRLLGAYLKAHRPVDDGTEGYALLLTHLRQMLEGERVALPERFFDPYLASQGNNTLPRTRNVLALMRRKDRLNKKAPAKGCLFCIAGPGFEPGTSGL